MNKKRRPRHGSTVDDFLKREGVLEEFRAAAVKDVIARQIQQAMKKRKLSKNRMAALMDTSRAQLDRLLDPKQGNISWKRCTERPPPSAESCAAEGLATSGRRCLLLISDQPRSSGMTREDAQQHDGQRHSYELQTEQRKTVGNLPFMMVRLPRTARITTSAAWLLRRSPPRWRR
jgi:hypothetical protein